MKHFGTDTLRRNDFTQNDVRYANRLVEALARHAVPDGSPYGARDSSTEVLSGTTHHRTSRGVISLSKIDRPPMLSLTHANATGGTSESWNACSKGAELRHNSPAGDLRFLWQVDAPLSLRLPNSESDPQRNLEEKSKLLTTAFADRQSVS